MFGKILNMLLNWVPKLKMLHFKISLNIKGRRQRLIGFIFVNTIQNPFILNSTIYHSYKREPSPFFIQIPVLGHVLIHSIHKTHDLLLTKILLTRTNSKIFEPNIAWSNVKLISLKYFKTHTRKFTFHVAASRVLFVHFTPAFSRSVFRTPSNI